MTTFASPVLLRRSLLCCAVALQLFSAGLAGTGQGGEMATMVTRISAGGFSFFSKIFAKTLVEMFRYTPLSNWAVNFSRQADSPPVGSFYFEQLHINEFVAPNVSTRPMKNGNVHMGTTGGTVNLSGRWILNHTMDEELALPSPAYGEFSMQTTNMISRVELKPYRDIGGTPQLKVKACTVSMKAEDVNVIIKGIPKKNLKQVQKMGGKNFKDFVEKMYCKGFPKAMDQINTLLTKFRTGYPLAENITVQYNYSSMESGESAYTFTGFVDFLYDNTKCHLPQSAVDVNKGRKAVAANDFMMIVWLSESVFNCFLDSLYRSYQSTWTSLINRNTVILGDYLATSCNSNENCLGSFVPGLPEAHPNNFVNFYFISVNPPRMVFSENSSSASLSADINIQMRLADTNQELVLLNVIVVAQLEPYIKNNRVSARLMSTPSVQFTVTKSEIGQDAMRSSVWESIIHYVQPIIMAEVDQRLANGLPLPALTSIGISNGKNEFSFADHQVKISFNFNDALSSSKNVDSLHNPKQYDAIVDNVKLYDSPLDYYSKQNDALPNSYLEHY